MASYQSACSVLLSNFVYRQTAIYPLEPLRSVYRSTIWSPSINGRPFPLPPWRFCSSYGCSRCVPTAPATFHAILCLYKASHTPRTKTDHLCSFYYIYIESCSQRLSIFKSSYCTFIISCPDTVQLKRVIIGTCTSCSKHNHLLITGPGI